MYALWSFITLNVGNCYFMRKDGHERSAQYATYRKLTPAAYYIKRSVQCSIVTIKVVGCSSGPYVIAHVQAVAMHQGESVSAG